MIRNIKALGLAAFACLAMGAVFASAAHAVENPDGEFTAGHTAGEHTGAFLTGEQYGSAEENFFATPAAETACTNTGVSFEGEDGDGTSTSVTITPSYEECELNGLAMTVRTNGCNYTFTQPEMIDGTEHETWTGTVDLVCPGEEVVELDAYLFGGHESHSFKVCTTTVLPKEGLGDVVYHNDGNGETEDDITVDVDIDGIDVEEHGGFCPDGNTNPVEAEYVSSVTLRAYTDEAHETQIDAWISTAE